MANTKDTKFEVPSRSEITEFILNWNQNPESMDLVLKENQYTPKRLAAETGYGVDWSRKRLQKMYKAGLCTREAVGLRTSWTVVYTFPKTLILD